MEKILSDDDLNQIDKSVDNRFNAFTFGIESPFTALKKSVKNSRQRIKSWALFWVLLWKKKKNKK